MVEQEPTRPEGELGGTGRPEKLDYSDYIPWKNKVEKDLKKMDEDLKDIREKDLKDIGEKINQAKKDLGRHERDLEIQKNRVPEIVGLFSAIIALVLIDVSIIKQAPTFLAAILLITALTCSIAIFAWLIHLFFSPKDKIKFKKYFKIPIIILIILIVGGGILYIYGRDLYKIEERNQDQKQNKELNLPEKNSNKNQQQASPSLPVIE